MLKVLTLVGLLLWIALGGFFVKVAFDDTYGKSRDLERARFRESGLKFSIWKETHPMGHYIFLLFVFGGLVFPFITLLNKLKD